MKGKKAEEEKGRKVEKKSNVLSNMGDSPSTPKLHNYIPKKSSLASGSSRDV